jgi:hypothetical protein
MFMGNYTFQYNNLPIGSYLKHFFETYPRLYVSPEPVIVPPSWNKNDYHKALSDVWAASARKLETAENIFIIGYSLPETDAFFKLLYALGSVGGAPLRRLYVFNPDVSGVTEKRFASLLGPAALARYQYEPLTFKDSIGFIKTLFQTNAPPTFRMSPFSI